MHTEVKKWGNSGVVRIPKPMLKECRLDVDSPVDIRVEEGRIVVTPIEREAYNLDELLAECPSDAMELTEEDRQWLDAEAVGKEST